MYGNRKYGKQSKPVEQPEVKPTIDSNSQPTFLCIKCKSIRNQSLGYADIIFITINNISKPCYRVCYYCFEALTNWIKS